MNWNIWISSNYFILNDLFILQWTPNIYILCSLYLGVPLYIQWKYQWLFLLKSGEKPKTSSYVKQGISCNPKAKKMLIQANFYILTMINVCKELDQMYENMWNRHAWFTACCTRTLINTPLYLKMFKLTEIYIFLF